MRGLKRHFTRLRSNDEQGVTAVVTAILMVILLGFAAISVDVGMMYAERSQLQNGADSAALGVASNCASSRGCGDSTGTAGSLANLNANDDATKTNSVTLSANSVRVDVSSKDATNHDFIRLAFANIFGMSSVDVTATATAAWGGPVAGSGFPITFSDCQFDLSGNMQLLQYHMTDPAHTCYRGTSGLIVPGGFGSLQQDPTGCNATINIGVNGGIVNGRPGASPPSNCTGVVSEWIAQINAGTPPTVLFPVYDAASGTGGGTFHIRGFAAFQVFGWKFTGSDPILVFHNTGYPTTPQNLNCTGDCRGIIGKFVKYVTLDAAYPPGGPDLGLTTVKLIK